MTPQDAVAIFTIISYNKISVLLKSMDHLATFTEELRANNMDAPSSVALYKKKKNYTIHMQACMLRQTDIYYDHMISLHWP